jgi:transcription elongation factor GreA
VPSRYAIVQDVRTTLPDGARMTERTVYLTREGRERLDDERLQLINVRRPQVLERLRLAKEFADTTDNAEYDDVKREQAFVEGRIIELQRMLFNASIIAEHSGRDFVTLGCTVQVRDADGEVDTYMIVGTAEADPRKGRISNESPIGRALLGKKLGDRAAVVAPSGSFEVELLSIT